MPAITTDSSIKHWHFYVIALFDSLKSLAGNYQETQIQRDQLAEKLIGVIQDTELFKQLQKSVHGESGQADDKVGKAIYPGSQPLGVEDLYEGLFAEVLDDICEEVGERYARIDSAMQKAVSIIEALSSNLPYEQIPQSPEYAYLFGHFLLTVEARYPEIIELDGGNELLDKCQDVGGAIMIAVARETESASTRELQQIHVLAIRIQDNPEMSDDELMNDEFTDPAWQVVWSRGAAEQEQLDVEAPKLTKRPK